MLPQQAKTQIKHELIRRGELAWLLHSGQKDLYDFYKGCKNKFVVFNCARRFGKSYLLVIIALEHALKHPGAQIRFATDTKEHIQSIFTPLINQILNEFPPDVRPVRAANSYKFHNGSELHLAGADYKNGDNLRGTSSDLIVVDEAGFVANLKYLVQDILMPQLMYSDGKLVMASTPPKSLAHPFADDYIPRAIKQDAYAKKTVFDNPRLTKKKIDELAEECRGYQTDTFKREYECELISDSSARIVPEFIAADHVKEMDLPDFFYPYTVLDFGVQDATAVLAGYVDFKRQKLVILDEFIGHNLTTQQIADSINRLEGRHFAGNLHKPTRFGDNDLQILLDLGKIYKLHVQATQKYEKDQALANLRDLFLMNKIEIHPRCKSLIHQLSNGVWNKTRNSFERSETMGHCDAIDALIYFARNARFKNNPTPAPVYSQHTHVVRPANKAVDDVYLKMYNLKRKRRP